MRRALAIALCAAVVAVLPAAAFANTRSFHDRRGDVKNGNDIVRYTVTNGAKRITVVTHHRHLNRKAFDIQFWVKNSRNGQIWHAYKAFDRKGAWTDPDDPMSFQQCDKIRTKREIGKNRARISVPFSCLGKTAGRIKVRVRVQWSFNGHKGDWAPGKKGWSGWVKR